MQPRILIADDQADILSALKLLLKREGFDVATATSPAGVLDVAAREHVDVALVDLNYTRDTTSGEEGLELVEQLRKQHHDLPVVVMTAWATVEVAVQAMRHGANDFLEKPWNNQRLLSVLRNQVALAQARQRGRRLADENAILRASDGADLIATSRADAGGRAARAPGRALGCERADHRRAGHRQEPARAADARLVGPRGEILHRGQCRRPARDRVRERDVRPREGRLHRREGRSRRALRARGRRHAVPRRDRQRAAAAAGAAVARARDRRIRARRLVAHAARRRARDLGDQRRPAGA